MAEEIVLKIVIIGDPSSGKTQLILEYVDGYFPSLYVATIGVEYKIKKIQYKDIKINLQIWDTAGQERFLGITKNFLKGADGIIYLYDISNKNSFDIAKNFIIDSLSFDPNVKKILVGNNLDLEEKRQVSRETVKKLCDKLNIKEIEISTKLGTNISQCFKLLVESIIGNMSKEELLKKYREEARSRKRNKLISKLNKKDVEIKGEDKKFPKLEKYISF